MCVREPYGHDAVLLAGTGERQHPSLRPGIARYGPAEDMWELG